MLCQRRIQICLFEGFSSSKCSMSSCNTQAGESETISHIISKLPAAWFPNGYGNRRAEHLSFTVKRSYLIKHQRCCHSVGRMGMDNGTVTGLLVHRPMDTPLA